MVPIRKNCPDFHRNCLRHILFFVIGILRFRPPTYFRAEIRIQEHLPYEECPNGKNFKQTIDKSDVWVYTENG